MEPPLTLDPRIIVYKRLAMTAMSACTLLTIVLWAVGDLPVHRHEVFRSYVGMTALMATFAGITGGLRARLGEQVELPALRVALTWAPELFQLLVFLFWIPGMITIATYLVLPYSGPLSDAWLATPELALGLPHPTTFAWFQRHGLVPWFEHIYGILDPQVRLLAAYYLLVKRDLFRLWQYTAALAVAGVASVPVLWALPAVGPTVFYDGAYPVLPPALEYIGTFEHLRQGVLASTSDVAGLLACPSFHTVFAVYLARAWFDAPKPIFAMACVVNGLVVVSTIPVGSHYLIDIVGGLVWALLFAIGVDRLAARSTP